MVVIFHQHICMQNPTGFFTGFEKALLEPLARSLTLEYPPSIIATIDNVVYRPLEFQSYLPRHQTIIASRSRHIQSES